MLPLTFVYLDNAATTPVLPIARTAVMHTLDSAFGNPSSLHTLGVEAELVVTEARRHVAAAVGGRPDEIVFTSGGTEANALALLGAARARSRRKRHIITTDAEHSSVLNVCARLEEDGFDVTRLGVDSTGLVDPRQVTDALRPDTALISVMWVNNEVGAVQPVAEIAKAVKTRDEEVLIHADAVQALGKLPLHLNEGQLDLVSLSAHKIHGPKGVGALWMRQGTRVQSPLGGGSQERGARPGTENVPGIAGFGAAAAEAAQHVDEAGPRMVRLRERLWQGIRQRLGGTVPVLRNGPPAPEFLAPHIVNVSFLGLKGEVLVHALAEAGVYASTGSACSSRRRSGSDALRAMGLSEEAVEGALRFSLSPLTTKDDIDNAVGQIAAVTKQLYEFAR